MSKTEQSWRFPVETDLKTGAIAAVTLEDDIRQSILILLGTRPGERLGRSGYGCGLLRFTFENITYGLIKEISSEITDALGRWEERIENVSTEAINDGEDGSLIFTVRYKIRETGARGEVHYELNIG